MQNHPILPTEVIYRRGVAVDFRDGHSFFDDSGRAVRRILEESEDWIYERSRDAAQFTEPETNLTFSFGSTRMTLDQQISLDVNRIKSGPEFGARAEVLMQKVIGVLKIEQISRIGYQVTHLYPTESSSQSQQALLDIAICAVPDDLQARFGEAFETGRSLFLVRPDHLLRIQLNGFEQAVKIPQVLLETAARKTSSLSRDQRSAYFDKLKAKKMIQSHPKFGIQLDLDAYLNDPRIINISSFVSAADKDMISIKNAILARKQT